MKYQRKFPHLTIPWCVKDKAHRVGNALIVVHHLISIDHISGLVSWQCFLQFVN